MSCCAGVVVAVAVAAAVAAGLIVAVLLPQADLQCLGSLLNLQIRLTVRKLELYALQAGLLKVRTR